MGLPFGGRLAAGDAKPAGADGEVSRGLIQTMVFTLLEDSFLRWMMISAS